MDKDTLIVILSDMHTGSTKSLFLPRSWQGKRTNLISPTSSQVAIRKQWDIFKTETAKARKDKKVILIHCGDSTEGLHHTFADCWTQDMLEMADCNIELLNEFKKAIKWQKGDQFYVVKGTECHTDDMEDYIGREMGAVPDGNFNSWDELTLNINGKRCLFYHHGALTGKGANEGNGLTNSLKNIYFDALKDGDEYPDLIVSGHVHRPTYSTFVTRKKYTYRTMHGLIVPSWQEKTRYAFMRAPVSKNVIGGVFLDIKADGTIGIPQFIVRE